MNACLLVLALQVGCGEKAVVPAIYITSATKMYYRTATDGVREQAYFDQKINDVDEKKVKYGDRIISVPVYNGYLPAIQEYKDGSGNVVLRVFDFRDHFTVAGKKADTDGVISYNTEDMVKTAMKTTSPPAKVTETGSRLFPASPPEKKQKGINEVIPDVRKGSGDR